MRDRSDPAGRGRAEPQAPRDGGAPPRPAAPVLVVEDDTEVCAAMVTLLRSDGYQAVGASNGREAFEMLERGLRPCVILLDLGLPVMSGPEFRSRQLGNAQFAVIPVIVFSGRPEAADVARSLRAVAALAKPVDFGELRRLLDQHCIREATVAAGATLH